MTKRRLFREVNERIRSLNSCVGIVQESCVVLCECDEPTCFERFDVPTHVHAEIADSDQRYLVTPGHEHPGDLVVNRSDRYVIVNADSLAA